MDWKDPEQVREYNRIAKSVWRTDPENRKKEIEAGATWRRNNPDKVKAGKKKWHDANFEADNARTLAWRKEHPGYMNAWYAAHPGKMCEKNARRAAAKAGVSHVPYTVAEIYERDKGVCGLCHKRVAKKCVTIDHVLPLSLGGDDAPYNVQIAHLMCNSRKYNTARFPQNLRLAM